MYGEWVPLGKDLWVVSFIVFIIIVELPRTFSMKWLMIEVLLTSIVLRWGACFHDLGVLWGLAFYLRSLIQACEHLCVDSQLSATWIHNCHILEILDLVVYKAGFRACYAVSRRNLSRVEHLGLCEVDIPTLEDWFRAEFNVFSDGLVSYHQWL